MGAIAIIGESTERAEKLRVIMQTLKLRSVVVDDLFAFGKVLESVSLSCCILARDLTEDEFKHVLSESAQADCHLELFSLSSELQPRNFPEIKKYFDFPKQMEDLVLTLRKFAPPSSNPSRSVEVNPVSPNRSELKEFSIENIRADLVLPFSLFAKVASDNFIKISTEGDRFSERRLGRYLQNQVFDELYYLKSQHPLVLEYLDAVMDYDQSLLASAKDEPENLLEEKWQSLQRDLDFEGFDQQKLEVGRYYCELIYQGITKKKKLNSMLNMFFKRDPANASHSFMTAIFSSMLASQFSWNSAATNSSIIMGGIFHDVGLLEIDDGIAKMDVDDMGPREKKVFFQHPILGAKRMETQSGVTPLTTQIILQHHEHMDGTGFPYGRSDHQIGFCSKIVNFVDEFVDLFQEQRKNPEDTLLNLMKNNGEKKYSKLVVRQFAENVSCSQWQ